MRQAFEHLLSPLQVGSKRLRNRVLISAHVPRLAVDNLPSPAYVAYHRVRAGGGAGLQITGAHAALRGQTAAHLLKSDVDRFFDQAKKVGLMRIEFGAGRMALLAYRPLPGLTPPPHPPDRCGHTNPEPRRRLPRR